MGEGPPHPPQVLGDGRRPPQCPEGFLLLPHRLAARPQAPRRPGEGAQAGAVGPEGGRGGHVPKTVRGHKNRVRFSVRCVCGQREMYRGTHPFSPLS